jgi:hypothetical protein
MPITFNMPMHILIRYWNKKRRYICGRMQFSSPHKTKDRTRERLQFESEDIQGIPVGESIVHLRKLRKEFCAGE